MITTTESTPTAPAEAGDCGRSSPAQGSGVPEMVAEYQAAAAKLRNYRSANFRDGGFVKVDCPRFSGFGILIVNFDVPPDQVAVRLENGNTWWYPLASVVPVADVKSVPRSVRRTKLRCHGYQLTGCSR